LAVAWVDRPVIAAFRRLIGMRVRSNVRCDTKVFLALEPTLGPEATMGIVRSVDDLTLLQEVKT